MALQLNGDGKILGVTQIDADAGLIGFTPVGNLSAGNVQAALAELDSEKVGYAALATTGGAALVGFSPAGNISATTVQAALAELDSEKASLVTLATSSGSANIGHGQGTVKVALDTLAGTNGAANVGRGAGTVEDALTGISTRIEEVSVKSVHGCGLISNNSSATAKNITLIGDSISHGAFALNTFMHGWARILNRMVNAEVGANSYGFTNPLSLGSGATYTAEIHGVNFYGGTWGGIAVDSAQAAASPAGYALRSSGVGSTIDISLPFFQNRALIHYIKQPGGGTFTVSVNGSLVATVDTSGTVVESKYQEVALADAGYGNVSLILQHTVAGTVDIIGPSYLSSILEPVFNNYSASGRRLRYVGQSTIQSLMLESSVFIMALGHNDQGDADLNDVYYGEFTQRINWLIQYAKQYNVKVVVPDFCWTAPSTSRTRGQLMRLAIETKGVYVDLPSMIFSGGQAPSTSYLIDTLKMWTDGSHPNKNGMKWIAETVAKSMGLSCTSKTDAILFHDFWMPLELKSATGVTNYFLSSYGNTSAYKRNGDSIIVKAFLRKSPGNAFPVGQYSLTDAWNSKSEISASQGATGYTYLRMDTGAAVGAYQISATGALNLNVLSSYLNEHSFTFTVPGSSIRTI